MKTNILFRLSISILLSIATSLAAAQAHRSYLTRELLAHTRLSRNADIDVLPVRSCSGRSKERVTAIKVRVKNRAARIDRLMVKFENGRTQDVLVGARFPRHAHTAWMDLRGDARCIRKIRIIGSQADPAGGQADIEIMAKVQH